MTGAERLTALALQPDDRRQELLRRRPSPSHVSGGCRHVSQLPHGPECLAEVAEQVLAPASDRLAQREHRVEMLPEARLEAAIAGALVDDAALLHDVAESVGHPRDRGLAVAAGAAGLLVVALDGLRQVDVRDEAHVGLVDAHAERDRRDHHDAVVAEEPRLVRGADRRVEARVVRQRVDALRAQVLGGLLDGLAAERVDDARARARGAATG